MNKKLILKLFLLLSLGVGSSGSFNFLKATYKSTDVNALLKERFDEDAKRESKEELSGESSNNLSEGAKSTAKEVEDTVKSDSDIKNLTNIDPKTGKPKTIAQKIKDAVCFDDNIDYQKEMTELNFGVLPKNPGADTFDKKDPRFKVAVKANWGFSGSGDENLPLPGGPKYDGVSKKWVPDPVRLQVLGIVGSVKLDAIFLIEKMLYGKFEDFVKKALATPDFSRYSAKILQLNPGEKNSTEKPEDTVLKLEDDELEDLYESFKDSLIDDKGGKIKLSSDDKGKALTKFIEKYLIDKHVIVASPSDIDKLEKKVASEKKDKIKYLDIFWKLPNKDKTTFSEEVLFALSEKYYRDLDKDLKDPNKLEDFNQFLKSVKEVIGKKDPKSGAKKVASVFNDNVKRYIEYYYSNMEKLNKDVEDLTIERDAFVKKLEAANKKLVELNKEIADKGTVASDLKAKNKELADKKLQAVRVQLNAKKSLLGQQIIDLDKKYADKETEGLLGLKSKKEIKKKQQEIALEKETELENIVKELADLEIEINALEAPAEEASVNEENKGTLAKIEELEKEINGVAKNEKEIKTDDDNSVEVQEIVPAELGLAKQLEAKNKELEEATAKRDKRFRQDFKPWLLRELLKTNKKFNLTYDDIDTPVEPKISEEMKDLETGELILDKNGKVQIIHWDLADVTRALFKIFKHEKQLKLAKSKQDPERNKEIEKLKSKVLKYHFLNGMLSKIELKKKFLSGKEEGKSSSSDVNSIKFLSAARRDPIFPSYLRTMASVLYFMTRFTELQPELVFLSKVALLLKSVTQNQIKAKKTGAKNLFPMAGDLPAELIKLIKRLYLSKTIDTSGKVIFFDEMGMEAFKAQYKDKADTVNESNVKGPVQILIEYLPDALIQAISRVRIPNKLDRHLGKENIELLTFMDNRFRDVYSALTFEFAQKVDIDKKSPTFGKLIPNPKYNEKKDIAVYKKSGAKLGPKEQLSIYEFMLRFVAILWQVKNDVSFFFDDFISLFDKGADPAKKVEFQKLLIEKKLLDKFMVSYKAFFMAKKAFDDAPKDVKAIKGLIVAKIKLYTYIAMWKKDTILAFLTQELVKVLPHMPGINLMKPYLDKILGPTLGIDLDTIMQATGSVKDAPAAPAEDEDALKKELGDIGAGMNLSEDPFA